MPVGSFRSTLAAHCSTNNVTDIVSDNGAAKPAWRYLAAADEGRQAARQAGRMHSARTPPWAQGSPDRC